MKIQPIDELGGLGEAEVLGADGYKPTEAEKMIDAFEALNVLLDTDVSVEE